MILYSSFHGRLYPEVRVSDLQINRMGYASDPDGRHTEVRVVLPDEVETYDLSAGETLVALPETAVRAVILSRSLTGGDVRVETIG